MFRPNGTYVSFRPVATADVSKGGIVLTDQPKRAQVVAIGPGKMLSNGLTKFVTVKPGEFIIMTSNAFIQELMVSGERVYYVDADFIAGTVDAEDVISTGAPEEKLVHDTSDDIQAFKVVTSN